MVKNKLLIIMLALTFLSGCESYSKIEANNENKKATTVSNIKTAQAENNTKTNTEKAIVKDYPIHIDLEKDKDGIIASEDENYIYYCLNNSINKIDKANGEIKILSVQPDINSLSLVYYKDYLYFVTYNKGKGDTNCKVFKMNVNSGEYFKVFDIQQIPDFRSDYFIRSLLVIEDTIYMDYGEQVCSYNMNTKEVKQLADDVEKFDVVGEDLYYIDHAERTFTIYKKNLKTMKTQIVLGEGISEPKDIVQYRDFIFIQNEMYYETLSPTGLETEIPEGLFAYNNGKPVIISSKDSLGINSLIEYKGELYYIDATYDKEGKIIARLNNKNGFKIAEINNYYFGASRPKIINDYLYYKSKENENEIRSLRLDLQK
jgi:hypothetical protein